MRRRQPGIVPCLLLIAMGVIPAPGQQPASAAASQPLTVYVVDFPQPQSSKDLGDLAGLPSLASGLIQLRLLQVPSLTVHRVPKALACGTQPAPDKGQQQAASTPALRPAAAPTDDFYLVHGSIEVRLPDIFLDYVVEKCEAGTFKPVLKDTHPFTADRALEELTVAAHTVAFRLEQWLPRTRIVVAFEVEGDSSDRKEVLDEVQRRMKAAITESSNFEVAETGEYKIGGKITFDKRALPLPNSLVKWNALRGEFYIQAGSKNYPVPAVRGSRDKLPEFYAKAVEDLKRSLAVVALADKRGWSDLAGTMETKALFSRGREMLDGCPKQARCSDAREAIPLLATAVSKDAENRDGLALLGRAQVLAGEYADAVKSLERARDLLKRDRDSGRVVSPSSETGVLNLLGDAYRKLRKYAPAASAYDASLRIEPSQADIYNRKSLALRSAGKRPEALQALLDGLLTAPAGDDATLLHGSAKDVIRVLEPDEFPIAEQALAATSAKGTPVANEQALLISRTQTQLLDTATAPVSVEPVLQQALKLQPSDPDVQAEIYANLARVQMLANDLQKVDVLLTRAENLPTDKVSAGNREWIARIRANYWYLKQDYTKAFQAAYMAHQIRDDDDGSLIGAMSLLALAQEKEKAAGANTRERKQEIQDLFKRAAVLAEPLVTKRYPNADGVLVAANHSLVQDAKTRQQLESVIKNNPKDDSAINALMLVCSQYLFDFDCAFSVAKLDVVLHDPNAPDAADAYLNLAEAAILVGNDDQTQVWLRIALNQRSIAPREKALAYLYRLWLDMRQAQTGQFLTDFHSWQTATEQFRQGKNNLDWLFLGARKALRDSNISQPKRDLLAAMMDAMEDNSRPLPIWLESAAR